MNDPGRRIRAALEALLADVEPPRRPRAETFHRARRRRALAAGAVAAAALLVGATAWGALGVVAEDRPRPANRKADDGPHLFLSGKYGRVWRVGLDGSVVHADVAELNPGDPPHHLLARGDALVGWGYETYLLDPELVRPPELLARDSVFFIPSAHEDRLWIATRDDDPATEGLVATVREVTVDGEVTVPEVRPPRGGWPEAAVTAGLVFFSEGERIVWDPRTDEVVARLPDGDLGPASGNVVAWCDFGCARLYLENVATGATATVDPPPGTGSFRAWEGAFSPDGKTLALPVRSAPGSDEVQLALVDVEAATATAVPGTPTARLFNFVAWGRTGRHVFFTGADPSGDRAVFVYELGEPAARRLEADVGEFYDAAAI